MPTLLDPSLTKTLNYDRDQLVKTEVPIITVAGTFREEIKSFYGLPDVHTSHDIVLSRAHFSMALGLLIEIWGTSLQPNKAWMADPTNYVSQSQWRNVLVTEFVGKVIARESFLKSVKDLVDRFGRGKLPILKSITSPLLYLTQDIHRPIICFHIAAGNVLAGQGKTVIQIITDPHVREEYVEHANLPNIFFCVFDDRTKLEFLEIAAEQHIKADPDRVIVTGPPIDPRIIAARKKKAAWRSGPLKLCMTTGGIGTNKQEMRQILLQLMPLLSRHSEKNREHPRFQLLVYAGTQEDIFDMMEELAEEHHVSIGEDTDDKALLRVLYHPQILEANELLIRYGFPWADGFITKPSGDMAYDAVAAGCFLMTLKEWGVWEERIREIFEQKDIAVRADAEHIIEQLNVLQTAQKGTSWIERAMNHALGIEKLFLFGNKKIAETAKNIAEKRQKS